MKNVVIFAIDNGHDLHQQAKFLRHLDTLRSMGKLKGEVKLCIGSWKGQLERSYAMHMDDYHAFVFGGPFIRSQEAVVAVHSDGEARLWAALSRTDLGRLGVMTVIDPALISLYPGWTYVEAEGVYYAAG